MSVDLKFKYGISALNSSEKNAGNIYVRKIASATNDNKDNGRAKLYIDTPVDNSGDVERLSIGSDVFVGDPDSEEASNYDVIINPNGGILENIVTGHDCNFKLKVEKATGNIDTYVPSSDGLDGNTIIFVVE